LAATFDARILLDLDALDVATQESNKNVVARLNEGLFSFLLLEGSDFEGAHGS